MTRSFLEVDDLSPAELKAVLALAELPDPPRVLEGLGMALVLEKPSARSRNATEMAVVALGGHPVTIRGEEVGLDDRESVEDVARTLGCYHAVIGARVFAHDTLVRMAGALEAAGMTVPVVNLLSDLGHPCQALADLLTLRQCCDALPGLKVAYVGDGNNVCRSLVLAGAMTGMRVRVASPSGFQLTPEDQERVAGLSRTAGAGATLQLTDDPAEAVAGADAVYTDVWASMGQEADAERRRRAFRGFQVDDRMLAGAAPGVIVMHCLPAHRGDEISASAVDGPRSVVWRQAANRLHATRGLLAWLLGPGAWAAAPGSTAP